MPELLDELIEKEDARQAAELVAFLDAAGVPEFGPDNLRYSLLERVKLWENFPPA